MIELTALTNALTDITIPINEKDLELLEIEKGSVHNLSKINKNTLLEIISKNNPVYCQAGSPANTIFNAAVLGIKTALLGSIGNDALGEKYIQQVKEHQILPVFGKSKGNSGICYILVTPDGERTQLSGVYAASAFNFNLNKLKKTKIFHTSGYELSANPDRAMETLDYARKKGSKISFDLADEKIVRNHKKNIEEIIKKTDILFATEEEAQALTGLRPSAALEELNQISKITILKKGSKGSIIRSKDEKYNIPPYQVKLVNTCGAGDAYAAGFLFAYIRGPNICGSNLEECGHMGSFIASRVCGISKSHLTQEK